MTTGSVRVTADRPAGAPPARTQETRTQQAEARPAAAAPWCAGSGPADAVTLGYLETGGAAVDPGQLGEVLGRALGGGPVPVAVHETPGEGWDAVDHAVRAAEHASPLPFGPAGGAPVRAELHRWAGGCLLLVHVHPSAIDPSALWLLEAAVERCWEDPSAGPEPSALTHTAPPAGTGPSRPAGLPPYRHIVLERPVLDGLLARAADPEATPGSVLFAVYALALAGHTGRRDLGVGLAVPGPGLVTVGVHLAEGDPEAAFQEILAAAARAVRRHGEGRDSDQEPGHEEDLPGGATGAVFTLWPLCASRTLRLGGAELAPVRLRPRITPGEVLAEVIDPSRPDGRLHLRLTSDPAVFGEEALHELAAAVEDTARRLAADPYPQPRPEALDTPDTQEAR